MEEKNLKKTSETNIDSESSFFRLNKPLYIFGKDVREIKCFRDSFIFGICCGIGGGLISFLATSRSLFSSNAAFVSLWIGVFGYWIPCRYKYENSLLISERMNLKRNVQGSDIKELPKTVIEKSD